MSNVIVFGQCSINCCQWGSLTPTGRDKETDGSRLCGLLWLWPDCAALFTVGGVRVFMCARLHKQTHLCHDREKRCRPYVHNRHCSLSLSLSLSPSLSLSDGFPLSLNRRATAPMALHAAIPHTKQCRNLTTESFIYLFLSVFLLVILTCWRVAASSSCWHKSQRVPRM